MQWSMVHQHQVKEPNALVMNKKIMSVIAEIEAAIRERNAALSGKNEALAARDEALRQRDEALLQRDNALMERDNALAALQIQDNATNFSLGCGTQSGSKRTHHSSNQFSQMAEGAYRTGFDHNRCLPDCWRYLSNGCCYLSNTCYSNNTSFYLGNFEGGKSQKNNAAIFFLKKYSKQRYSSNPFTYSGNCFTRVSR